MAKTCQICGKPSGMYPLCPACFKLRDAGKAVKCEECGTWHLTNKPCSCKPVTTEKAPLSDEQHGEKEPIIINKENKLRCIACGYETDGLLFCVKCYHKYKDKKLYFSVKHCSEITLESEDYEGDRVCKDGHIVKSKSERDIDNYLFEHGIAHCYEKPWSYGKEKNEYLKPDFCLPNYLGPGKDVYIEHWGFNENNQDYQKTKKFKMKIYKEKGITLVCTHENTDTSNPDAALDRKLNKNNITENAVNFEFEKD